MNIELTTTERNALVNILRRNEHSDGARSILSKIEPTYKIGDRFICTGPDSSTSYGEEYILAQVATKQVCLIPLSDGNYHRQPRPVMNPFRITKGELEDIIGVKYTFRKIGEE